MVSHDGAPSTPARVGSFAWGLVLVWLPVQALVRAAFSGPYHWTRNGFGDLGAVRCGVVAVPVLGDPHYVCSPWHQAMNAATAATGLLALTALLLTRWELWPRGSLATTGVVLLGVSAVGRVLSGAVPEDVHASVHLAASAVDLCLAPVAMVVLGLAVRGERTGLGLFTFGLGAFALLGLLLAGPLGLGVAGAERLAAYPVVVWMVGMGALVFDRTLRARRHSPAPV